MSIVKEDSVDFIYCGHLLEHLIFEDSKKSLIQMLKILNICLITFDNNIFCYLPMMRMGHTLVHVYYTFIIFFDRKVFNDVLC